MLRFRWKSNLSVSNRQTMDSGAYFLERPLRCKPKRRVTDSDQQLPKNCEYLTKTHTETLRMKKWRVHSYRRFWKRREIIRKGGIEEVESFFLLIAADPETIIPEFTNLAPLPRVLGSMASGIGFALVLLHPNYRSLNSRFGLSPNGGATDHAHKHRQEYSILPLCSEFN